MLRRSPVLLFLLVALSSASANATIDWKEPDPVVRCFASERGEQGEWKIAGPPFRLQGPLKPPGLVWPRPRRTCGAFELSLGAQTNPGPGGELFAMDVDMRLSPAVFFFVNLNGFHGTGEFWVFGNMPLGLAFVPRFDAFGWLFGFDVRGLVPTATTDSYRAWGVGIGASAVRLFTSWLEVHAWLGPDFTKQVVADTSSLGFAAQVGVQMYPTRWFSFVLDQHLRVNDVGTQAFPAAGVRFVYEGVGLELGGGVLVPAGNPGPSQGQAWVRFTALFGS